ncbi:MAG: aconitase X [Clostridia bacterium]|nr:aconitase X [Clostridia bacterium]
MVLTSEQQAILDGSKGETMAKVMETLIKYGEIFGATKMVPVTSEYGHLVLSFGLMFLGPVFDLYQKLIDDGCISSQKFTCDPRPYDPEVPQSLVSKVLAKIIYSKQKRYDAQLKKLGLLNENSYTCTCYMPELGNIPKKGDILSWAESSAVVYANSVLGARCNRNSGIIELFGSVCGFVPYFGFLTDEGRKAKWIVKLQTTKKPDAQLLGSAIGMKVTEDVPYIYGLDKYLGNELNDSVCTYLKDFGAATASNGAVGLYHIDGLTPEAVELKEKLILENAKEYIITDEELQRVKDNYPVIWKNPNAKPKMCFLGCPHMSLEQLKDWTNKLDKGLKENKRTKVSIATVFTTSNPVHEEFKKHPEYQKLIDMGVIISYICPLMYMDNPLCQSKAVITSSNKLRTYTTTRYYSDDEILEMLTKGVN